MPPPGMPAPGEDLGGWYAYDPNYDYRKGFDLGFAPGCTFGQWVSALARVYAITGDEATREKVLRLNRLYAQTISADFYDKNRFPAYTFDKLLLGHGQTLHNLIGRNIGCQFFEEKLGALAALAPSNAPPGTAIFQANGDVFRDG